MSTSTNTSLYNAMGVFIEKMRPYVIDVIKAAVPGMPWEGELFRVLGPDQQRIWNKGMRSLQANGGDPATLIDIGYLFPFGLNFKDALIREVGGRNEANKLIGYFKELQEVRNKCQHFQVLDEDELTRNEHRIQLLDSLSQHLLTKVRTRVNRHRHLVGSNQNGSPCALVARIL